MTIDYAITVLDCERPYGYCGYHADDDDIENAMLLAMDIMEKYQKIQKIIETYNKGTLKENDGVYAFRQIREVVEE